MTDTKNTSLTKVAEIMASEDGKLEKMTTRDRFLAIVNTEPPKDFVKDHPMAKGVKYIPIDKVETMLTKIFQQWRVEVLRESVMLNSLHVTVRLHYLDPIENQWTFQDGVGAVAIQVDKGENASNLGAIKSDAIMKGLPSAKSFAIKDAAENIGKLFGRDINRKDTIGFTPSYTPTPAELTVDEDKVSVAIASIGGATSMPAIEHLLSHLNPEEKLLAMDAVNTRIKELVEDGDV